MKKITLLFIATLFSALSFAALNPYAYGLKSKLSDDEKTVTLTYSLNAPATAVNVVILDGETVLKTQSSTGITQGEHSVAISTDGFPKGKTLKWKVEVKGAAHNTTNNHGGYRLYHPSGVDVDNNPESPHFGRIICNEAMHTVISKTDTYLSAEFGAGIFEFTPAFEPKPNGSKPGYNGGITFTNLRPDDNSSTAYAPRRVRISEDGRIFVSSLNTDGHVLWEVNPDNLDDWTEVIAGTRKTGDINSVVNGSGTYIGGPNAGLDVRGKGKDLHLALLSGMGTFQCNEYNLGTETSWNKAPSRQILGNKYIVSNTGTNIEYDNEGGLWFCQYRGSASTTEPALLHINANGEVDYLEGIANVRNGGFRFNPSFTKVITADGRNKSGTYVKGYARIYDVSKDANGKPVLTLWKVIDMSALGHSLNDFAWDIADNVYVVGHNSEWIRAYALARTADDVATTPCSSAETFSLAAPAQLTPFAYGLESTLSLDETTLTIKYSLNALATSVNWVLLDGNNVVKTVDLASLGLEKGDYTTTISTTDFPQYKQLTWKIEVKGVAVGEVTEYPINHDFYHPSSVDIDNNPENPTFGLILCNEAMQSVKGKKQTDTGEDYLSSSLGAGIYAFNPAFENTGKYNGGIEFTTTRADGTGTAYSPRRIRISDDGRIFVTSLNTDGNYLWEVNPENMNEWTPVFKGTLNSNKELVDASSNFVAAPNVGFDVRGEGANLKLLMLSSNLRGFPSTYAVAAFKCHEYNLGTATTWSATPSKTILSGKYMINYTGDQVAYDAEGGVWFCQHQGTAKDDYPSLVHIDKNGVEDYKEVVNNRMAGGFRFNNDFTKVVIAGIADGTKNSKKATVYAVSKDANGKPVLTEETIIDMKTVGNNLNDFAWDYAGNLYACGNSSEKIAVWAMPHSSEDAVATPAASKYAFSIGKYSMIVNTNDENKGTVTGAGEYKVGETATLTATAKEGYKLLYWSDRSTENPRTIIMNKNEAISAYFVKEYDEEQTFTITKVWENTNVPETNPNGYQAVGWDEKVYLQASADSKIKLYSNGDDAPTEYATSSGGYQIAVDEVGNLIVFNAYFATATPGNVLIYKKGSTTGKTVTFTLPNPGRCDFFSASGDIYSAEGGYVYFYCNDQTVVNRAKITNGAATDADVTIDVVGENLVKGCSQNHVVVDIFGNLLAQSRLNGVRAVNVHTDEAKSFFLPEHKTNTLGGCSFELGGKEFWAYNVGTNAYTSEWKLYNITDKTFLSESTLYAKSTTETNKNQAANWLNVQVVDENTAYIYQYCPTVAVALWKVSRDIKYNVSATAENGTVTGAGKYKEGTTATLTATPNARYEFVNWTKGGVEVSTDATYSFEVTEDVEFVANFSKKPDIAYELNGGQWNKYGWTSKKDMYDELLNDWRAYSGSSRTNVSYETQFGIGNSSKGIPTTIASTDDRVAFWNLFTDATYAPKWGWLATYVDAVAATQYKKMDVAQGIKTQPTSAAGVFTFTIGNFFGEDNAHAADYIDAVDFTGAEAHPDAFQPTWGHLLSNPTQPTTTIELGSPYRGGYEFGGWYAESDFSGVVVTTVDENTDGTLYAKWIEHFYTRSVTSGNYGTICLPYGSSDYSGAEFYEIAYLQLASDGITPANIYLDQVTTLEAGKPYIFKATADELVVYYEGAEALAPMAGKAGLTGTFEAIPSTNDILEGNYMIAQNKFWLCAAGCWLDANRAYIEHDALHASTTPVAPMPGRRRVSMGAAGENAATGSEDIMMPISNSKTMKIIENGQVIIIRDGEKYNMQGQKL